MSRYQKGRTNLDYSEARDSEWQWHQLGHMQVCTSLQTENHTSTPPLRFLQAGCPSCRPTNSIKALKAYRDIRHKHHKLLLLLLLLLGCVCVYGSSDAAFWLLVHTAVGDERTASDVELYDGGAVGDDQLEADVVESSTVGHVDGAQTQLVAVRHRSHVRLGSQTQTRHLDTACAAQHIPR